MRRSDFRGASVLARTELRARARHVAGDRRRLLSVAAGALVFAAYLPYLFSDPALDYGARLAGGDPPIGTTGALFAAAVAVGLYLGGSTAFLQSRFGSIGPLARTSVPPAAVVTGRLASEAILGSAFFVPTALALLVLAGVGAGGPVAPLLLLPGALPALLAGLLLGRVAGSLVRYANLFSGLSAWTKILLWGVVAVAAFVAVQFALLEAMETGVPYGPGQPSFGAGPLIPGAPLQAYAGVVLAPLGAAVRPQGALVVALVLAAIPASLAAAVRLETALLFEDEIGADAPSTTGSRAVPRPFDGTPSARVAWRYLLRTRRDPKMLAHLPPFLFGLAPMVVPFVDDPGAALVFVPPAALIGGAVLAGGMYCLNPLGDDRDQLPFLLTSARSTAVLLQGRALAGVAVGLVLAVGVGAPVALVAHSPTYALAHALFAVVVLLAGAGTALGIGSLVPKFERREYMNVERAHPSNLVLIGYMLGCMLVGGIGSFLFAATLEGASGAALAGGWAVYLAVIGASGAGGYLYSVRKFDALALDDAL